MRIIIVGSSMSRAHSGKHIPRFDENIDVAAAARVIALGYSLEQPIVGAAGRSNVRFTVCPSNSGLRLHRARYRSIENFLGHTSNASVIQIKFRVLERKNKGFGN